MSEQIGTYLGQYWLSEVVGRGNTSTVYKAYQTSLGRYVAVKVLRSIDASFAVRFQREAQAIALLQHPNILPIFDYGEVEGQRFFVLQYIEGSVTLERLLDGEPIAPLAALRLLVPLLDALDYAHGRGVIHRDIKPSNVLMATPSWPLLADFGIAKLVDETGQLTPPGQAVGTALYIAPERVHGRTDDERGDLYSVGVVLYEMLTGRVPFQAQTPVAVLTKHMYEAPPPPRMFVSSIPVEVEQIVLRTLQKDPAARYQSAVEMAAAVRSAIAGLERDPATPALPPTSYVTRRLVSQQPPNLPPRRPLPAQARRRAEWAPLAVIGLLGLIALLSFGALTSANGWPVALGRATQTPEPRVTAVAGVVDPAVTLVPTTAASATPEPTLEPTLEPTAEPTIEPTLEPTLEPTPEPTLEPTPEPTPEPTLAPTAVAVVVPTAVPEPPTPRPTPPPPPDPPLVVPPPGVQTVRLEDTAWTGGFGGAGNPKQYGGRTATWIYGQSTGYETMAARVELPAQPSGEATLTIEGMDSEDRAKTPLSITINGAEIFRGPDPLPNDDQPLESGTWAAYTWSFDAQVLQSGPNEIRITNLAPGQFSRPPFVMLDYAELTFNPAQ